MRLQSLLFLLLPWAVRAAPDCPSLPAGCQCSSHSGSLTVTCYGGNSTDLLWKAVEGRPVNQLTLRNCSIPILEKIPRISGLRSLEVSSCNVSRISEKAFFDVGSRLLELNLSGNKLTSVPFFGSLPQLTSLNLNGNQLTDIAESTLEGLSSLRQLRVRNNRICALSGNSLNEAKGTLEFLDLAGNCFTQIPAQQLRNNVKLGHLDMSDNRIAEVNNFQLMNLPLLKELRLNNNLLNKIAPMAFMNVPQLRFLYMRNNLIGNLDGTRLQAFKQLEVLDLTSNLLQKLPSFKELTRLRQVFLDGNLIAKIETLAFSNNPRLQLISLQNNNVAQISRNSFDSLDQLVVLLLSNNSIRTLERGMLDGMKNLQQLDLRNNSLSEITASTFTSLRELTAIDLAHNQLTRIGQGAFTKKSRLFWLDVSNNKLSTFEKDSFDTKVSNIIMHGNQLVCDSKLDWFVEYLVVNRVRTFLPYQPEILCAGPGSMAGTRLKDLMMKAANETLSRTPPPMTQDSVQRALLGNLIPGLSIPGLQPQQVAAIPGLAPILENHGAILQQLAGTQLSSPISLQGPSVQAGPPSMIVNLPGYGNIDISRLPPDVIAYVLKGGQIPGVPKETLDSIVREYMARMQQTSAASQVSLQGPRFAPGRPQLVTSGGIQQSLPILPNTIQLPVIDTNELSNRATQLSAQAMEMLKILPPGYDLSRIPADVLSAISKGQLPDLSALPKDLQDYLKSNSEKLISVFSKTTSNLTIEEILSKLPKFDRPELPTFSPYDINLLNNELVHEEEQQRHASRVRVYTAVALGAVGAVTVVVLGLLCVYMRKHRRRQRDSLDVDVHGNQLSPKAPSHSPPPVPPVSSQIRFHV